MLHLRCLSESAYTGKERWEFIHSIDSMISLIPLVLLIFGWLCGVGYLVKGIWASVVRKNGDGPCEMGRELGLHCIYVHHQARARSV